MTPARKTKVLIVDDSAVVRQVLQAVLARDPGIDVLGAASDPIFAMERMRKQWPDVLVLDVEMPRMDGITFLKKLMAERPLPVVICSTLTEKSAKTTIEALAAGAVDIVTKPRVGLKDFMLDESIRLIHLVKAAAKANTRMLPSATLAAPAPKHAADGVHLTGQQAMAETTEKVLAIGTSTGGTLALEAVLTALPKVIPGTVIVQHMPEKFTASFAERLDGLCAIEVREGRDGERVVPGCALIAPGGRHMLLKRSGAHYYIEVRDGPLVNRHRPSVDVLFRSAAKSAGPNALGIIMTGMGNDGARGLKQMHDAGAPTIAQDEATSVVYGMPKEAIKQGGVDQVLALHDIPPAIIAYGRG